MFMFQPQPDFRRFVDLCGGANRIRCPSPTRWCLPFVFHSDGKLWEVIPDLIAVGVTCYVRPENYHAMRQAVFEYGKYPIQL